MRLEVTDVTLVKTEKLQVGFYMFFKSLNSRLVLLKKAAAFLLSVSMLLVQTGTVIGGEVKTEYLQKSSVKDAFSVPADIGLLRNQSMGSGFSSKGVVVQIQDSHCLYEAQKNIGRILNYLSRSCDLKFVAVEGAAGEVDLSLFGSFPDRKVSDQVVDELVRDGLITGPEQLVVKKYREKKAPVLFGVEDPGLYCRNLNAFRDVHNVKPSAHSAFEKLSSQCDNLKKTVFSEKLLLLEDTYDSFLAGETGLGSYVKTVVDLSGETLPDRSFSVPNLDAFLELSATEKTLDQDSIRSEQAALYKKIEDALPEEDLKDFLKNSLIFRLGKITPKEYYKYIEKTASDVGFGVESFKENYPNLYDYIKLVRKQSVIDIDMLLEETDLIKDTVKDFLFESQEARKLDALLNEKRLLDALLKLEWTRDDLDKWNSNSCSVEKILDSVKRITGGVSGFDWQISPEKRNAFVEWSKKCLLFYELALKRDRVLLEKTLEFMHKNSTSCVALVSGGFHSAGISDLLKEKGYDFVVLTPRITSMDFDTPYLNLMTNQKFNPVYTSAASMSIAYPSYTMIELLDRVLAKQLELEFVADLVAASAEADSAGIARLFSDWKKGVSEKYIPLIDEVHARVSERAGDDRMADAEGIPKENIEKLIRTDRTTGEVVLRYLSLRQTGGTFLEGAKELFNSLYGNEAETLKPMRWKNRKKVPEAMEKMREGRLRNAFRQVSLGIMNTLFAYRPYNEIIQEVDRVKLKNLTSQNIFITLKNVLKNLLMPPVLILGTTALASLTVVTFSSFWGTPFFWGLTLLLFLAGGAFELVRQVHLGTGLGESISRILSWSMVVWKGISTSIKMVVFCMVASTVFPLAQLSELLNNSGFWLLAISFGVGRLIYFMQKSEYIFSKRIKEGTVGLQNGRDIFIDFSLEDKADFASVTAHEIAHRAEEMGIKNEIASMVDHLVYLNETKKLGDDDRIAARGVIEERLLLDPDEDTDDRFFEILIEDPVRRERALDYLASAFVSDSAYETWVLKRLTLDERPLKETPQTMVRGLLEALYVDERAAGLRESVGEGNMRRFVDMYVFLSAHISRENEEELRILAALPERLTVELDRLHKKGIGFPGNKRMLQNMINTEAPDLAENLKNGLLTLALEGGGFSRDLPSEYERKYRFDEDVLKNIIFQIMEKRTDIAEASFQPPTVLNIAGRLDDLNIDYGDIETVERLIDEMIDTGLVAPVLYKLNPETSSKKAFFVRGYEEELYERGDLQRIIRLDGSIEWLHLPNMQKLEDWETDHQKRIIDMFKKDREIVPVYGIPGVIDSGYAFEFCYYSELKELINKGVVGVVHGRGGRKGYFRREMLDRMRSDGLVITGLEENIPLDSEKKTFERCLRQ